MSLITDINPANELNNLITKFDNVLQNKDIKDGTIKIHVIFDYIPFSSKNLNIDEALEKIKNDSETVFNFSIDNNLISETNINKDKINNILPALNNYIETKKKLAGGSRKTKRSSKKNKKQKTEKKKN